MSCPSGWTEGGPDPNITSEWLPRLSCRGFGIQMKVEIFNTIRTKKQIVTFKNNTFVSNWKQLPYLDPLVIVTNGQEDNLGGVTAVLLSIILYYIILYYIISCYIIH